MRIYERIRFILILVSGLMALSLLTWGIGRSYLDIMGRSDTAKNENAGELAQKAGSSSSTLLVLPEAKFWTCQVGVFQNESNAEQRQEQLKVLNIKAEIIGSNPWLVCLGLGHTADDLQGLKQVLLERGVGALTKQIQLSQRTFRVTGNGSQLTAELLLNTNAILRSGITTQVLEKEKELWVAKAGLNTFKDLEVLHGIFEQLREKTRSDEQIALGLELFLQYQTIINKLSGK